MPTPLPSYTDGLFVPDAELTVIPRVKYPFANNPTADVYSKLYERDYQLAPSLYQMRIGNRTSFTNLIRATEDWSSAWGLSDTTFTAAIATAPDGNVTMGKLLEAATTATHYAFPAATTPANAQHFFGFFVRGGLGRNFCVIEYVDFASVTFNVAFNVATGSVVSKTGSVTPYILPIGNGDCLYGFFFTPAAGSGNTRFYISSDGSKNTYLGDITKGLYAWGAMLVACSALPPYISTTSGSRTISAPDRELTINANAKQPDPFAYLVGEPDPNNIVSRVGAIMRTFARVPNQQTVYSTLSVTKPNPSSVGTAYNFQTIPGPVNLGANYVFNGYAWDIVNNWVFGPLAVTTSANSGANTRLTWTGHGVTTQKIIVNVNSTFYEFTSSGYTVVDANTIDLLNNNFGALATQAGKYLRDYTPALVRLGCKVVSDFYLPGVSVGITTPADITVPTTLLSASAFLAAVVANLSGYVTYDVKDLAVWRGPIYQRDTLQIKMDSL